MAPPPGTLRVGRYLTALVGLFVVLYALIAFPGEPHKPKLGIDLVGGTRVIFKAVVPKGAAQPTSSQMSQARQIIEDRINTTGVTGATVAVQGTDQLVVEIPSATQSDVARLGQAAVLNFRPLLAPIEPITCGQPKAAKSGSSTASSSPSGSPSASKSSPANSSASAGPNAAEERPLLAPTPTKTAAAKSTPAKTTPTATGTASASGSASSSSAAAPAKCLTDPLATVFKADPTLKAKMPNAETCPSPGLAAKDCKAYSALSATQQQEIAAALRNYDCNAAQTELDKPDSYYVACGDLGGAQGGFLLGHVIVKGRQIDSASAQAPSVSGNGSTEWTVSLTLGSSGADRWNAWTGKYNTKGQSAKSPIDDGGGTPKCGSSATLPCSTYVGFTLNGQVISYPVTEAVLDTRTSISGSFTQSTANALAKELNYGKLPISFRADSNEHVSATLGKTQLHAALLAGGIGLALVVIYSLLYYRGLGLVTIASLLVSGGLTFAMLVILGKQIGFTLDLAGVAGFIVALGITADSFVVFFERIKDEVHDGRSLRVAVPRAWVRARRTILSADTVSFLAAAILYYFASADVKGFAFTLGMSTILDLVVVFLFTHPVVSLLARSRAFGSPRFTGLNSVRAGGIATADDSALLPKRRSARRTSAPRRTDSAAAVAVLDDDVENELDVDDPGGGAGAAPEPDAADRARRRTTPASGSAAERAAARRARLRGDSGGANGKGDS
ncbi:MAG: protein translocase subunit SecD [Jatrophihabitans sp.]|uniref:protein translocase subunit SecD n=1 Tax=Jatrophihabitans sp. TaxID=1932789 RepID=UPI00390E921D